MDISFILINLVYIGVQNLVNNSEYITCSTWLYVKKPPDQYVVFYQLLKHSSLW